MMKFKLRYRVYLYLLSAVALYLASPFRIGMVSGDSMSPSMHDREWYVYDRQRPQVEHLDRGDVVIFERDNRHFIKRVAALPGDTVYLVRHPGNSGQDELVQEWQLAKLEAALRKPTWSKLKLIRRRVPLGTVFVLGDHLQVSEDSRAYGPIQEEQLLGKLLAAPPIAPALDNLAVHPSRIDRS